MNNFGSRSFPKESTTEKLLDNRSVALKISFAVMPTSFTLLSLLWAIWRFDIAKNAVPCDVSVSRLHAIIYTEGHAHTHHKLRLLVRSGASGAPSLRATARSLDLLRLCAHR